MNSDPLDNRLGRFLPDDWEHLDLYPLSAIAVDERLTRVPVVIGVNWYEAFGSPEQDPSGEYWVARSGSDLGRIRGGHCVCLEPGDSKDRDTWYEFYDQGSEGACVGFGWSRCMSLLNDELYSARWLWDRAKEIDEWPDTNPGDSDGTSVRAAARILRRHGHVDWDSSMADDDAEIRFKYTAERGNGIRRFRWAQSVDEIHQALGNPEADRLGAVPFLNSWGPSYPRRTWMPDSVLARLIEEGGEFAVPTDR